MWGNLENHKHVQTTCMLKNDLGRPQTFTLGCHRGLEEAPLHGEEACL